MGNYAVRLPEATARKSVDRFLKARENYPTKEVKWDNSGQRFVPFQLIILTIKIGILRHVSSRYCRSQFFSKLTRMF